MVLSFLFLPLWNAQKDSQTKQSSWRGKFDLFPSIWGFEIIEKKQSCFESIQVKIAEGILPN